MQQKGHFIAELRLIFKIVPSSHPFKAFDIPDCFLTYVQRFDIVPQTHAHSGAVPRAREPCPEPSSSLYVLKRAKRSDGSTIGDVVPLHQFRALLDLIPRFHEAAARSLTDKNSSTYSAEYFLNKYFNKELFWALHK